ncbi:MAG: hypothetical protein U1F81_05925 [Verrucomicrobiaceae bacterium]
MNLHQLPSFLGLLLFTALGFYLIGWLCRMLSNWLGSRSATKALSGDLPKAKLMPESQFIVTISEQAITCQRPDGTTESVRLDDLQKVDILTTSDGPFAPDVFWLLHGSAGGCSIPQGATGEPELLDYLQTLPAFDNQAVIQAMGSTQEALFTCWKRLG